MANLFLVVKDCQNIVSGLGVEVFWCATGATGDPLTETTIGGSTIVNFLASGVQMTAQVVDDARAKYLAVTGVAITAAQVKTWGGVL